MDISIDNIDPNLKFLIESRKSRVSRVIPISTLNSDIVNRKVFKITFEDNFVIKGRTYVNDSHAKKVYDLSKYLVDINVSKPLAISGNSMLLEWINGYPADSSGLTLGYINNAGKLMAQIHSIKLKQISKEKYSFFAFRDKSMNSRIDGFILSQINQLNSLGLLTKPESEKLKDIISDNGVKDIKLSLVCGDMCAENLVIGENNNLYIVDTENLSIDSVEYDLARVLYRWPMNKIKRTAFMKGYLSIAKDFKFSDNFIYWIIRVLAKSAAFRSNIPNADVSFKMLPIKNLKMITDQYTNSFPNFIDSELMRD